METTLVEPELTEEDSVVIPDMGEFVSCTQCGHRSYMFFFFMDDLLPFCVHHGEKNFEKLTDLEAPLVADYRATLAG